MLNSKHIVFAIALAIFVCNVSAKDNGSPWIYTFRDWAHQKQIQGSDYRGYNAKSTGVFIGIDSDCGYDELGFGLGVSQTRNSEYTNQDFNNHILRWHAMTYGKHRWACNNYLSWLLSGSYNTTYADRPIFVDRNNDSFATKYHGYTFAAKVERGKGYPFWDHYMITPKTYLQYTHLDQPTYKMINNNTAWRLDNTTKNYVTIGVGVNLNWPTDAWRCVGMREIRMAFTYDALSDDNITNLNFVADRSGLLPACSPKRFAFLAGAGFTYVLFSRLDLSLNYDFESRPKFVDNIIVAKLRYTF